jgi:DNA-directed RNA polymerase subunit H (RpoH/RPB5)
MEVFYEKYLNIQKFINEYRKYSTKDEYHDFAAFKKAIQIEEYIVHSCVDTKRGRPVYIYLFKDQAKYTKTTPQFKRLMDKLPEEPADVIILSKDLLSIYINKALIKYNHLRFFNYLHKFFAIELSKGPLCSKHTILTNNEVRDLCSRELLIHPLSLPSISINDPQNIWLGGELGQIVKIESVSEITGKTIRYRIISPDSGKVSNMSGAVSQLPSNESKPDDSQAVSEEIAKETPSEKESEYIEIDNDESASDASESESDD